MAYKVIITARSFGNNDKAAYELLTANGCEYKKLVAADGPIDEQLKKEIVDADAVIAGLEDYTPELIASAKKLKVISRYGVGYDKVDTKAAAAQGIKVTITPGANGDSVADLAMALMLNCARNVCYMNSTIVAKDQKRPTGLEMCEKTLGVVGTGRIGQGVARRCKGFGMKIICYDIFQNEAFAKEVGATYVDLDTLLKEADFITLHSPLTPETKNMISTEQFKMMKKTAVLVNTARGGIVDEDALYTALTTGEIYAAGLDATVAEPPYDSPLNGLPNCVLTPHAGAATVEAGNKMSLMAAQNAIAVLTTGDCKFKV